MKELHPGIIDGIGMDQSPLLVSFSQEHSVPLPFS